MFGISSFAQVPFASLAGTAYTASVTEDVGMADANTQMWSFGQTLTENVVMTAFDSEAGFFVGTIVETFSVDDSSTQVSAFGQTITEPLTSAESETISAQFASSIAENSTRSEEHTSELQSH